jgi:fatty acid desaturase
VAREVPIQGSEWTAKVRNPGAPIGLSIVTLGIYSFWWWYFINREMDDLGEVHHDDYLRNSPGLATLAATVGAFVIVPPLVTLWRTCHRVERAQERTLGTTSFSPALVFFLAFVPFGSIAVSIMLQSNLNRVWEQQGR